MVIRPARTLVALSLLTAVFGILTLTTSASRARAEESAPRAQNAIGDRGDIVHLPAPLKSRIVTLANRPTSAEPTTAFSEADSPSQLYGYYLLDSIHFQKNVFNSINSINTGMAPTAANCANHGLPTIGSVRLTLEPKPGLPTDPNNPESFIDIFTDISGLFVINNESGWYEGWMIHDVVVPHVADPRPDGHAQFGRMTQADADAIAAMGGHNNVPGRMFTLDGNAAHEPRADDHFPDKQTNLVPVQLSMGAYNCLQQSDCHSYWELNEYTNWVFPLYEQAFTGGQGNTFAQGRVAFLTSIVPGSGPNGTGPTGPGPTGGNSPTAYGDNPNNPRDPDRLKESELDDPDCPTPPNEEHAEKRLRFIPSNLANEILLDVYVRVKSFEAGEASPTKRLFDAYAAEIARIDSNGDGVLQLEEADIEGESDGLPNTRLYIPGTKYNRFAVTREINDGLLAPRFSPSQRAWILSGSFAKTDPAVDASIPRDNDNR
jgi:hypothetical protein